MFLALVMEPLGKIPTQRSNWHPEQLNNARRGLELLKVGGALVYSIGSINQVESEAVIAAFLNEFDGNLELVDVNRKFPGLNWLPGFSYWKVFYSKMNEYFKYEDVPENMRHEAFKEMFPPVRSTALTMNLNKCMRFLPQLNDDGSFLVATLRRKGHFNAIKCRKQRWYRKENSRRIKKFNASKLDGLNKLVEGGISFHHDSEVKEEVDRSLSFHDLNYLRKDCMCQVQNSGSVVRLVSPSLKDILHKGNNRLKISFACSGVGRYVLKSSCFHLLPTSSNGIVGGSIKDVKLLMSVGSVEIENLLRDCQRMLWSSEIGWTSSSNRSFHQERRDEEKANRSFHQERRDDQIEIHCRNNEEGEEGDDAGQIFEVEYHEESFNCPSVSTPSVDKSRKMNATWAMVVSQVLTSIYSFHRLCCMRKMEFMILQQYSLKWTLLSSRRLIVGYLVQGLHSFRSTFISIRSGGDDNNLKRTAI